MNTTEEILNGKSILIVDDDVRNTFALVSYLENCGMKTFTAEDGFAALNFLSHNKSIDIVLMDMMMPGMDGYETIQKIKNDTAISHIPIIAVTAKAMKGDREKCLEAGASEYVSKPVNMNELFKKMAGLMSPAL